MDDLVRREVKVYGLTTGFASLKDVAIPKEETARLSRNLIVSHCAGVGAPFAEDVVRAAMLLRAQTLARGNSGVRPQLVQLLVAFLNARMYPFIPCQGSCGSSGDLAPLSHLFLALLGETGGRFHPVSFQSEQISEPVDDFARWARCQRGPGTYVADPIPSDFVPLNNDLRDDIAARLDRALRELATEADYRLEAFWPYELQAKEGLASNNGAVFSTALLALSAFDAEQLAATSESVVALSFEALQAVPDCLDEGIAAIRPHPGHLRAAEAIRSALADSTLVPAFGALGLNMARLNRAMLDLRTLENDATKRMSEIGTAAERDLLEVLAPALGRLYRCTAAVQDRVWAELERCRSEASDILYPKERELAACRQVFAGCLSEWRRELAEIQPSTQVDEAGEEWSERLHNVYRQVKDVVRSSPDVQDNYSFRAAATVIGTARDTIEHIKAIVEIEANSSTDNPLILLDRILDESERNGRGPDSAAKLADWLENRGWRDAANAVKSAANFHGQPVGTAADQLAIALAELGNVAERRVACLTDHNHSKGLPSYLVWKPGLNSGFMIPQYTAASLVAENRVLASPVSTDSVPTGEGVEDHVAMSTTACRHCRGPGCR